MSAGRGAARWQRMGRRQLSAGRHADVLRLVLRYKPRSVSQRFFGGNVEIAPSQPIDPDNGIA